MSARPKTLLSTIVFYGSAVLVGVLFFIACAKLLPYGELIGFFGGLIVALCGALLWSRAQRRK